MSSTIINTLSKHNRRKDGDKGRGHVLDADDENDDKDDYEDDDHHHTWLIIMPIWNVMVIVVVMIVLQCFSLFVLIERLSWLPPNKDPGHFVPRNAISNMFRPPLHP